MSNENKTKDIVAQLVNELGLRSLLLVAKTNDREGHLYILKHGEPTDLMGLAEYAKIRFRVDLINMIQKHEKRKVVKDEVDQSVGKCYP